jgi:hypothetical protein
MGCMILEFSHPLIHFHNSFCVLLQSLLIDPPGRLLDGLSPEMHPIKVTYPLIPSPQGFAPPPLLLLKLFELALLLELGLAPTLQGLLQESLEGLAQLRLGGRARRRFLLFRAGLAELVRRAGCERVPQVLRPSVQGAGDRRFGDARLRLGFMAATTFRHKSNVGS